MSGLLTTLALCGLLQAQSMDRSVSVRGGLARVDDVPFAQIERDGQEARVLHMDVAFPAWGGDEPLPVILYIHGGGWFLGSRDEGHDASGRFAEGGYFAATVDYRLGGEAAFPAAIHDVKAAVRFIKANAEELGVDPSRIGVVGYSAGGHLVALLGTTGTAGDFSGKVDSRLQCVVAGGAPCEFRFMKDKGRGLAFWLGGTIDQAGQNYHDATPVVFASKDDPPVLFFNGSRDRIVPLQWTMPLYDALKSKGVSVEMHKVDGADHMVAAANGAALDAAVKFLSQHLKRATPQTVPSPDP